MERRFDERKQAMMAECEVDPTLFQGMVERLEAFVKPFEDQLSTSEQRGHARDYVAGLCSSAERKTSETIAYFHDQDRQALQRFIGWANWDHRPLLGELAKQVGMTLGEPDGVLVLDSSAFAKKGTESVGVKRQWNGRAGKVDNCQVGVYLAYVSRREQTLVDVRLYLPKDWANARHRRAKCHVPREVVFATKLQLSLEMIGSNRAVLPHTWVVGDDEFGRSTQFRRDLRGIGERYLLAVPSNTLVRDLDGAPPPPDEGSGKRPLGAFVRVDKWCSKLPMEAWTRADVRDGEKGPLVVHVALTRVLAITERKQRESEEVLVVTRRVEDDGRIVHDYWLSNAAPETPRPEFARAAKCRGRIELCVQRGKSETGLADYETRSWQGWHHHQTLSLLASWFLVLERLRGEKKDADHNGLPTPHRPCHSAIRRHGTPGRGTHSPRDPNATRPQRIRQTVSLEKTQTPTAVASTAKAVK
jgi:SRSO17 transposase